ncbi:glycosyltransferase [Bifidobacterium pseudocatenulatum]|nr:glycosyltransferase [Bifidobacterium pseudocatenulatum]MZL74179.1 glycosyltransferase [Bifidobacterium pseudocatenulatum]MZL82001.1 glycosyltransferase [Bifidobacterium pseudocatenulatum]MZL83633.1 glycosyltransferase [Bifidobacterium pseudocatenulatum]MZL85265.1 glycosyltransferase [Bifidobacterium pseudocatenulatum]
MECMSETEQEETQRPLTIAMVVDTPGNRGNGTSNSALQWAEELKRQGHTVRLVGVGAPEYPARVNHVPLVSWVAKQQQMQFAEPSDTLFRIAFQGVDVVHIYTPFRFGQHACKVAKQMGIAVTAGYHVQPENITYSAGPLKYIPGIDSFIYWLFNLWLYRKIGHVHVPTELGASLLRSHGYKAKLHVISNGYEARFTPKTQRDAGKSAPVPFHIVASGRLTNEKNHVALIQAIARCRHAQDIELTIAGTGPLKKKLQRLASRLLSRPASIGFHKNTEMPALLRSGDLLVHPSIADLESVSVIEGMAAGLVPVIASSPLSAAGQFALRDESLFPVDDVEALARRIDWWVDHPDELSKWGEIYAEHTKEHYSVAASVRKFVAMEREAIADNANKQINA